MHPPVVIGIAGGSGSGKTTVLRRIIHALGAENITVLDHDAYYRPLEHLSYEERARVNFDHPEALETSLMRQHLDQLLAGEVVEKPVYNFEEHTRHRETLQVVPRPIVLLEGILVLAEPLLVERMDIKLFVDAPDDIRLLRRIRRDICIRGRTLESVLAQYEHTVRPMHLKFVEPSKRVADVIIPRGGHNHIAIDMIIARIEILLQQTSTVGLS